MARRKKIEEQVVVEDDEVLEAADEVENQNEEELVEFQASGEASSVPDPISTGSSARKADKKNGDTAMPKLGKTGVIQKVVDAFSNMTPGQASQAYKGLMSDSANKSSISPKGDAKAPVKLHMMANMKVKEDLEALFPDSEGLNEDFFEDAATIFESALHTKANVVEQALIEQYEEKLAEAQDEFKSELTERVDQYLDYVAEQWMEQNQIAIESAIQVEMAQNFMEGLKGLFEQNQIEIDDESVDIVAAYEEQIKEMDAKLEEQTSAVISLASEIDSQNRKLAIEGAKKGLTIVQQDEFDELVEGIDYEDGEKFAKKMELIKETNFKIAAVKSGDSLNEDQVDVDAEDAKAESGPMAAYAQAISRTLKK